MKAISLWQPWATLWLLTNPDEKVFETRHWPTDYRGWLLVHAAKKQDGEVRESLKCPHFQQRLAVHGLKPADLAFGALIGMVYLKGCRRMFTMAEPSTLEAMAGNWSDERYAWERAPEVKLFEKSIPYKGAQGFFNVEWPIPEVRR